MAVHLCSEVRPTVPSDNICRESALHNKSGCDCFRHCPRKSVKHLLVLSSSMWRHAACLCNFWTAAHNRWLEQFNWTVNWTAEHKLYPKKPSKALPRYTSLLHVNVPLIQWKVHSQCLTMTLLDEHVIVSSIISFYNGCQAKTYRGNINAVLPASMTDLSPKLNLRKGKVEKPPNCWADKALVLFSFTALVFMWWLYTVGMRVWVLNLIIWNFHITPEH